MTLQQPHGGAGGDVCRCKWAQANAQLRAYHDTEWGQPVRDSRQLWEMLVLETFQAGLSWNTVLQKRENFKKAFAGFIPQKVALLTPEDEARLAQDGGIIRSKSKIAATIANARAWLAMHEAGEDFADFAWGMVPGAPIRNRSGQVLSQSAQSRALSAALKQRGFRFVGPVIVYAWMQAVGMVDDHEPTCFRYQP
ncbi:DNA-3-methyladenine glycosylase I [Acetobacter sp. TBRC 12305]|uniref:DNA-3-methyladenine glycosylase I n=1 Tax=Acetobacter garciniae TaxID=2817435 RepID=A0A939HPM7_9PROT|nr:DNA-3-methyladenine glycosylase I [Acetobacter garciniae]MBO1324991.1 DNA-3-methyladenine glycosylase I [Acetobacter garciniae]MBX0344682.1 DNA-3-methyladenine glycosylase I [Acetobacter garciniae]